MALLVELPTAKFPIPRNVIPEPEKAPLAKPSVGTAN